jgi:hypothetical protein
MQKVIGSWAGNPIIFIINPGMRSIPKPNPPAPIRVYAYIIFSQVQRTFISSGILISPSRLIYFHESEIMVPLNDKIQ